MYFMRKCVDKNILIVGAEYMGHGGGLIGTAEAVVKRERRSYSVEDPLYGTGSSIGIQRLVDIRK